MTAIILYTARKLYVPLTFDGSLRNRCFMKQFLSAGRPDETNKGKYVTFQSQADPTLYLATTITSTVGILSISVTSTNLVF